MIRRRAVIGLTTLALIALGVGDVAAGRRAVLRCRETIVGNFRDMIHVGLAAIDDCHAAPHRGRRAVDCNQLDGSARFQRAQARAQGIVNAFCATDTPVLKNYPIQPGTDAVTVVTPQLRRRLEGSARDLQSVSVFSGDGARPRRRCGVAIGRARSAVVKEILRHAIRCATKVDRHASVLGGLGAACQGSAPRATRRGSARIARACRGLEGAGVGSCDALPGCAVASATATGRALARDLYGALPSERTSLCGNGAVDAGEECDDSNRDNGDGCTAMCSNARCGDGITETGVEECDDGDNDETNACTPQCKLAVCGDGIIETGVEECDDGADNGTEASSCTSECAFKSVACSDQGSLFATASLVPAKDGSTADFSGITTEVGYPAGLDLPGTGLVSVDDPHDPATRVALLRDDFYAGLVVFADNEPILRTVLTVPTPFQFEGALQFERVRFDCAPGEVFNPRQFLRSDGTPGCDVADESNKLGGIIDRTRRPTCRVLLGNGP